MVLQSMSTKDFDQTKKRARFQEGERVLCFHGPLIYEAKCLKVRKNEEGTYEYLIHYTGWRKSWDEWTTDLRILKHNEQNLIKQRELFKAHKDAKKIRSKALLAASSGPVASALCDSNSAGVTSNGSSTTSKNSDTSPTDDESRSSTPVPEDKSKINGSQNMDTESESSSTSSKKKRRMEVEPGVETEEEFLDKLEVKVKMPDELKPWLVDDWDLVCRQKKLIHLPAKTTVNDIVENYIKYKSSNKHNSAANNKENAAVQTATGIKEYFNATLGSQLLYKFERVQYAEILEKFPNQEMSSVYGAAHLLRLFVILGSLIVYTTVGEKTVQILKTQLQDFLRYLQKNAATLFSLQNYDHASAEYQRKSS